MRSASSSDSCYLGGSLFKSFCSLTFSQAAIVAFFTSLGDVGLHAALLVLLVAPSKYLSYSFYLFM